MDWANKDIIYRQIFYLLRLKINYHDGHKCDPKYFSQSKLIKNNVSQLILSYVSIQQIKYESKSLPKLITTKEIINIKNKFNLIIEGKYHTNDVKSVRIFRKVFFKNYDCKILIYKNINEISKNFF